jgi:NADH/F420H2 dehydrogenase subunit C
MTKEELKSYINTLNEKITFDENGEFLQAIVPIDSWFLFAHSLKEDEKLKFNYLFCLTCIDWKDHFMMVYHLLSKTLGHSIVIKVKLTEHESASVESVSSIWKTANLHEREVFDLFGIQFHHHPDLKRLFLPEDWNGHPLRKDYVDEINMIEL